MHVSPHILNFPFLVRTFKIYPLSKFQLYNTVLFIIVTMLCTLDPRTSYITVTLYPLSFKSFLNRSKFPFDLMLSSLPPVRVVYSQPLVSSHSFLLCCNPADSADHSSEMALSDRSSEVSCLTIQWAVFTSMVTDCFVPLHHDDHSRPRWHHTQSPVHSDRIGLIPF